jgi:hypothetical protein
LDGGCSEIPAVDGGRRSCDKPKKIDNRLDGECEQSQG